MRQNVKLNINFDGYSRKNTQRKLHLSDFTNITLVQHALFVLSKRFPYRYVTNSLCRGYHVDTPIVMPLDSEIIDCVPTGTRNRTHCVCFNPEVAIVFTLFAYSCKKTCSASIL